MRIDKITLKGFTTYQDEQVVDLAAIGSGIVAVAGPNGSGKTTLLEAVPGAIYRETPSRGSIAGLATARDARIELEGENGAPFRIRLDVDSHNSKQEAIICDASGEPLAGPKVKEFDAYIKQHLIPIDVYLASYFSSQTGVGSVLKMGKSDRRALFGRLLGLERHELMAKAAGDRARATESEMTAARAALDAIASQAEDVVKLEQKLSTAQANAITAKALREEAQTKLDQAIKVRAELEAAAAEVQRARKTANEARWRADQVGQDLAKARRDLDALAAILGQAEAIRKVTADIRAMEAELEQISARGEAAAAEDRKAQDEALTAQRRYLEACEPLNRANREAEEADRDLQRAEQEIKHAKASTGSVPCAGALDDSARSACPALAGHFSAKVKAEAIVKRLQEGAPGLTKKVKEAGQAEADAFNAKEALHDKAAASRSAVDKSRADYVRASRELKALKAQDRTSDLTAAEAQSAIIRDRIVDLEAKAAAAADEAAKAEESIPTVDEAAKAKAEKEVRDLADSVTSMKIRYEDGSAMVIQLETTLKAAIKAHDSATAIRDRLAPLERDLAHWRFLGRGFGREGVQALELDAAGPRVATLANELLADAYGSRFQVRFDTQAALASGKGVKETFDIVVVDSERGREGDGEDLSGGEKVIVGEALGLAVGLFHAQSAGANLGTVIRDETVGALDPENGQRYLAMLRAFLRVGRVHQLLFVAHQPALVDLADRVIRVDAGRISVN